MQHTLIRLLLGWLISSMCLAGCVTSKTTPKTPPTSDSQANTSSSSLKVFLLEREIPQDIEQLGVVSLSLNLKSTLNADERVKQQLLKECQRLGANGAYRINDGTYYPLIVSYLVFRYKK